MITAVTSKVPEAMPASLFGRAEKTASMARTWANIVGRPYAQPLAHVLRCLRRVGG